MVILTGENLGERHRDLNLQVIEAIEKNVSFEEIKAQTNISDVDMLFKIDLASKYKNVNYIIDVLKSGDSLHISRALKCEWLYDDDFFNIINVDYLQQNIFPYMSFKMKRKLLTTVSKYVSNEERAASFYGYCINQKLPHIALKFLIFTSENFKLEIIKKAPAFLKKIADQGLYLEHFIGQSFSLAKAYLNILDEYPRLNALYHLRYLFSVSESECLDLFENYGRVGIRRFKWGEDRRRFGSGISKNIIKKHKQRCIKNADLYFSLLKKTEITKNITVDDAKNVAVSLLPDTSDLFWETGYTHYNEFILNLIPADERFIFLKNIFHNKYPNNEFEMTRKFYIYECYKFMTLEEKESWALHHLETKKEILGEGCNFLWYKFISFKISFPEIKKNIRVTKDNNKRANILKNLIESSLNQRELEQLLKYYYERHVNEAINVLEFDNDCWIAFNKILYSIEIYNSSYDRRSHFITFTALLYHIVHKKDVPIALQNYVDSGIYPLFWRDKIYKKLNEQDQVAVYEYILQFYVNKIIELDQEDHVDNAQKKIECYINNVLDLLIEHNKTEKDCPDIVMKYINLDKKTYYKYAGLSKEEKLTKYTLLRYLKHNAKLVVERIPDVKKNLYNFGYTGMNQFLKNIIVYFANDIAKDYLNLYLNMLSDKKYTASLEVFRIVYGIFQLADEQFKSDFMMRYVPTEPKIDHSKKDYKLLDIQAGICRFACFARPPVPLTNMLMYIKGDYVHHCLPIFNSYLANLPQPLCLKFIKSIIDTPVSIHKHGLRMAFECLSTENLKNLILGTWKKSQNVSLRSIIYKALYNKIVNGNETQQKELFPVLHSFTLDLRDDDLDEVFNLLTTNELPSNLLAGYMAISWQSIKKLSMTKTNIKRKINVLENLNRNINMVCFVAAETIVKEHIQEKLIDNHIFHASDCADELDEIDELNNQKWNFVSSFIINFTYNQELLKKNVVLTELIMTKCIEMWNVASDDVFTIRQLCWQFINNIVKENRHNSSYEDAIPIYECVLRKIQMLPLKMIYLKLWSLKLEIINRRVKQTGKSKFDAETEADKKLSILKDVVLKFSEEVCALIKDFVAKGEYYLCAGNQLSNMVIDKINSIRYTLNSDKNVQIYLDDLCVVAASVLTKLNLIETYFLALYMLPIDSPTHWIEDYENIICKIKAFDNNELQYCLYQKFIESDFMRRIEL